MAGTTRYQDEDGGALITDINVTPLVDVVLVLLIIFMVTAKLIASGAIPIDSPKTVSGTEVQSPLKVTVDAERKLYVNGKHFPNPQNALAELKSFKQKDPKIRAIVEADTRVPHGDVMTAIDLVKQAGIHKLALAREPITNTNTP